MKKVLKLCLMILLILLLICIITGCKRKDTNQGTNSTESKTYNNLSKIFLNNNYIMIKETNIGEGSNNKKTTLTMIVKGDNLYTDIKTDEDRATAMVKDGITYIISHEQKMYMEMSKKDTQINKDDVSILSKEDLEAMKNKQCRKGKEVIDGTEYEYEEFKDDGTGILERYYWAGNDLKYVKSINKDDEEIAKIIKLSTKVDDSLFTIPKDYKKIETNAANN